MFSTYYYDTVIITVHHMQIENRVLRSTRKCNLLLLEVFCLVKRKFQCLGTHTAIAQFEPSSAVGKLTHHD